MCKQALNKFILYFVLCLSLKRKKNIAVVVLEKENESFDENTFVNKNLQNLKMYIQK